MGNQQFSIDSSNSNSDKESTSDHHVEYATDVSSKPTKHKQHKSKKSIKIKKTNEKGYSSDVAISSHLNNELEERNHSEYAASSSSIPSSSMNNNSTKHHFKNWWMLFNHDNIIESSNDYIYLTKNCKYIDELILDFNNLINLLINQVSILNQSEEFKSIHPDCVQLLQLLIEFGLENDEVMGYNLLQAETLQKFSCIFLINVLIDSALEQKTSKRTIIFNIMELITFYYDLFWVSFAVFIKSQNINEKNQNSINRKYSQFTHMIFKCLFNPNDSEVKYSKFTKRSRINISEYIASTLFMHICLNLKTQYSMQNENHDYTIQLIFPEEIIEKRKYNRNDIFRKNAMKCACTLLYMGAKQEEIEQNGMRIMAVDKNMFNIFGDQTIRIVNEVMIDNINVILEILNVNNSLWSHLIDRYKSYFELFILHNHKNITESITFNYQSVLSDDVSEDILFNDITHFKYEIVDGKNKKSKSISEKLAYRILNEFVISGCNVLSKFFTQSKTSQDEFREIEPNDSLPHFYNISYHEGIGLLKTEYATKLLSLMLFHFDLYKYKKYIGQFFVAKGNLSLTKYENKKKGKIGYNIIYYDEIRCNLASFLISNFRFFPSFDILLTLYNNSKLRYLNCHVNLEYLSNTFLINNFFFTDNGKKMIITFNVNIKKIRQSLFYNKRSATKKQRPPTKEEQIFIPFSWVEGDLKKKKETNEIAFHIKSDLDRQYKSSDRFCLNNLRISSLTQNDVIGNQLVALSTDKISNIIVNKDAVFNNQIANSIVIDSYNLYGSNIIFEDDFDMNNIDYDLKETIITNIKHSEMIKSQRNIKNVYKSFPINIGLFINNFKVFTHEATQIKCIDSFDINIVLKEKNFFNLIKNWSSLYNQWSLKTSNIIDNCSIPKL